MQTGSVAMVKNKMASEGERRKAGRDSIRRGPKKNSEIKEKTTGVVSTRAPLSRGYIVADIKKCSGCITCMLACSLVHEGETNLSLSRIQIVQSAYKSFPEDIELNICRQCIYPLCVEACPTNAMHVDVGNGNIRTVDESLCNGCQECIDACPLMPSRVIWNHYKNVAIKCDLCADTPYWHEKGGASGKQACVEICPMRALRLVGTLPNQRDGAGYEVNLRNEHWGWLGYPVE